MATWMTFRTEAPDLAAVIQGRFTSHLHHILATLRPDGAPRVSGTEATFFRDDVWLGSMPDSAKGRDLRRDPRFALHAAPIDTALTIGDAKLSGRALLETDPETSQAFARQVGREDGDLGGDLFRLDLSEATLTRVDGDLLHVDTWHPGKGVRHVARH